jgi:hypothetical protein
LAAAKGRESRKKRTRQFTYFPQVKGKVIESVEIDADVNAITILFQDKTALSFKLEPGLTVFPELSDWKTGNWRGIKRWRALHSKSSMVHGHDESVHSRHSPEKRAPQVDNRAFPIKEGFAP